MRIASFLVLFGVLCVACVGEKEKAERCTAGTVQECPCGQGVTGVQTCDSSGIFSECDCPDAGGDTRIAEDTAPDTAPSEDTALPDTSAEDTGGEDTPSCTSLTVTTQPQPNAFAVPSDAPITLTFSCDLSASLGLDGPGLLSVHSARTGLIPVTLTPSGDRTTVTLTRASPFLPGDLITVTLTGNWARDLGTVFEPVVFQFRVATPEASPGEFVDSGQSLGSHRNARVVLGLLNDDAHLDAYAAASTTANNLWINSGSGTFTRQSTGNPSGGSEGAALGDLDGDGDVDVFEITAEGQGNFVYFNNGNGVFTDSGQELGDTSRRAAGVALGDLDGDGDLDAFVGYGGLSATGLDIDRVFFNDGTGVFIDSGQSLGDLECWGLDLGDLDGDGDLDAVVANGGFGAQQPTTVWLNDGKGIFTDSGQALGSYSGRDALLADFDDDGDLDAFILTLNGEANRVWLNDGSGVFTDSGLALGGASSLGGAVGDIDGDGDLDVLVGNTGGATSVLYLNNGNGTFATGTTPQIATNVTSLDLGDLDGDGDLDAILGNLAFPDPGPVTVWMNQTP